MKTGIAIGAFVLVTVLTVALLTRHTAPPTASGWANWNSFHFGEQN
jgi:hypothetical protein